MPQPTKPGVDWPEIEKRYRSGDTATVIAGDHDVSRQAIEKRAKKQGWGSDAALSRLRHATAVTVLHRDPSARDRWGLRTPENAELAIGLAEIGAPYAVIAARMGMTPPALKAWRDSEPDFDRALNDGYAAHAAARLGDTNSAAQRGDAGAAKWLLERNPLTRDDFGGKDGASGPTLIVQINVPRSMEELRLIEGEAI